MINTTEIPKKQFDFNIQNEGGFSINIKIYEESEDKAAQLLATQLGDALVELKAKYNLQ